MRTGRYGYDGRGLLCGEVLRRWYSDEERRRDDEDRRQTAGAVQEAWDRGRSSLGHLTMQRPVLILASMSGRDAGLVPQDARQIAGGKIRATCWRAVSARLLMAAQASWGRERRCASRGEAMS